MTLLISEIARITTKSGHPIHAVQFDVIKEQMKIESTTVNDTKRKQLTWHVDVQVKPNI